MNTTSHTGWLLFALLSCGALLACGEEGKTLDPSVCPPQPLYHYADGGELVSPDGTPLSESDREKIATAVQARCITGGGFATTDTVATGGKKATGTGGGAGIVDAGAGGGGD